MNFSTKPLYSPRLARRSRRKLKKSMYFVVLGSDGLETALIYSKSAAKPMA